MVVESNERERKKGRELDEVEGKANTLEKGARPKMKRKKTPMMDAGESAAADMEHKRKKKKRKSEPTLTQRKRDIDCWESTDIAPDAAFFKDEYRSLTSEGERRKLERKIFWILHERENLDSIEQSMNNIQHMLLPDQSNVSEITDAKCPYHLKIFERTKPSVYRKITEQFKDRYIEAGDVDRRKEIVEKIGVSLHSYGFRFFAGKPGDKPERRMELNKILTIIELRMKRLMNNKKVPLSRDVEQNEENEDENDDEIVPFTADGQPTSKCILSGQRGKKRKANLFLQQQLQTKMENYKGTSYAHEKTKIIIEIRNNVRDGGYFFVKQDKHGVWSQDSDKEVSQKLRQAFNYLLISRPRFKVDEDDNEIGPLRDDGQPTSKSILPGTHNRKANVFFRACLMERMKEYEEAETVEKQCEIRHDVKMAIAEAGYFFLERNQDKNGWSQLTEKYIAKKIRDTFTYLLKAKKIGKPKVEEDEVVATKVACFKIKKPTVLVVDEKEQNNDVEHEAKQPENVCTQFVRENQDSVVDTNTVVLDVDSQETIVNNTEVVEIDLEVSPSHCHEENDHDNEMEKVDDVDDKDKNDSTPK